MNAHFDNQRCNSWHSSQVTTGHGILERKESLTQPLLKGAIDNPYLIEKQNASMSKKKLAKELLKANQEQKESSALMSRSVDKKRKTSET